LAIFDNALALAPDEFAYFGVARERDDEFVICVYMRC
jgi:hypothetical protein